MIVKTPAMAGTLESSDAQVSIEPAEGGVSLSVQSNVLGQYGNQIRRTVMQTLQRLGVTGAKVTVVDRGALDCTLRARVECAVFRAAGSDGPVPWGGARR